MDDEAFSRRANEFFWGSRDEMLCGRLWRNRWRWPILWVFVIWIDVRFWQLRGERWHCRRVAQEEAARMAAAPDPHAQAMDFS